MKSEEPKTGESFAEMFVDVKRSVPYYIKYGLALGVAANHAKPSDLCIVNLSKLLHTNFVS